MDIFSHGLWIAAYIFLYMVERYFFDLNYLKNKSYER